MCTLFMCNVHGKFTHQCTIRAHTRAFAVYNTRSFSSARVVYPIDEQVSLFTVQITALLTFEL